MADLQPHESRHRALLRKNAAECTVLLKKDGAFPLNGPCSIALYGNGARHTVFGGTGSGDSHARSGVTVETVVQLSKGERSSTPLRVELDGSDVDFASLREDATYPQIKNYVLERFGLKVTSLQIAQTKRKYGLQVGTNHNVSKKVKPVVPQCPLEKETAIREALLHFQMI